MCTAMPSAAPPGAPPSPRPPPAARALTAHARDDLAGKTTYLLGVANGMVYQERVGLVESILRGLKAFEMTSFVDFLPYIWGDLAVQHASKLLASMAPAERARIGAQLASEAARGGGGGTADSTEGLKVETVAATKLSLAPDPSTLLPTELVGWAELRPSPASSMEYDLASLLRIGAVCLELAAAQHAAQRIGPSMHEHRTADAEGVRRLDLPWPRIVFAALMRECTPPPRPGASTAVCAREALWAFLTACRTHGKQSTRARLLGRLCGAVKHVYHPQRLAIAMRVLCTFIDVAGKRGPPARLDAPVWLPLNALDGSAALDGHEDLPSLLTSMDGELGGADKVVALVEKLRAASVGDPRTGSATSRVVDLDKALGLVLDAFDSARVKLATALASLHEQLEVARVSGALDASSFCHSLRSFDAMLTERAAMAIYVDFTLAADYQAGGTAADPDVGDAVPRDVFIRICEEHGLRRSNGD